LAAAIPVRAYDDRVTDTDQARVPGAPDTTEPAAQPAPETARPDPSPGERRLARPPSDRYRAAEAEAAAAAEPTADPNASIARGVAVATAIAIAGAVAIVVVGGVLALTEVLLVVAGFTGGGVGIALRWGAGGHLTGRRRVALAVALALGAVALGQLGLWRYGLSEGGVLEPLDYLGQVYGPLVLVEFAAAGVVAWLAAR
jgi:hypothetical protein